MKLKSALILSMVFLFALGFSVASQACDAMGPNRHVGQVTEIDRQSGTFTIIDAQIRKPLTFAAAKEILDTVILDHQFIITYKTDGGRLEAEAVEKAQ